MHHGNRRNDLALLAGVALVLGPVGSHASGFSILEQSASRLGTAFSGTAAAADDATTNYFNPAGLVQLEHSEAIVVASGIGIASRFHDRASQPAFGQPLGGEGGDAGDWNFVPGAYVAVPAGERLAFGFGVTAPFGLRLEYAPDWLGRFQAIESSISTLNFNPSVAWRVSDRIAVGVGVSFQRIQAELTNSVNYSAVIAQGVQELVAQGQLPASAAPGVIAANLGLEGGVHMRGDDGAWGFNAGLTLDLGDATRIGLAYRSGITHEAGGTVRFATPAVTEPVGAAIVAAAMGLGGQLRNGPVSVDLELPDAALLSLCHEFGERYELLADVGWTGWSSVRELRIVRDTGELVSVTPEKWKDVLRYAIGSTYAASATLKLRAGVAYDGSAVPDKTRTPRLPEPARTWIAVGARWQPTRSVLFDFGYAHIFVEDAPLDQDAGNAAAYGLVNGTQKSSTDIVGTQLVYRF